MLKMLVKRACLVLLFSIFCVLALSFFYRVFVERYDPLVVAPATTSFVDVDGERIAYRLWDHGASTTVVFVGGLSAWNGTWERTINAARARDTSMNYLAIDLPPFGYSTADPVRGYHRDVQADRIGSLIEELGLLQVILVAHSYGGGPSAEYAMRSDVPVVRLVLIDAVLNVDAPAFSEGAGFAGIDIVRNILISVLFHNEAFALSRLKSFAAVTDHIDRELLRVYVQYGVVDGVTPRLGAWLKDYLSDPLLYPSTTRERYADFAIPVRLIWGEEDWLTPISDTEPLLATIPDVSLLRLPGVGHMPMIEDLVAFDDALFSALHY